MRLDTTYLLTLVGLFVILSPGLLLTLPPLSQKATNAKGVSYEGEGVTVCPANNDVEFKAQAHCTKATDIFVSGYTDIPAVFVHAVVFAALLYYLPKQMGLKALSTQALVALVALFVLLSPGLLLTLPALTKTECGENNKNVSDNDDGTQRYCDAITLPFTSAAYPKCHKCTSFWISGFTSVPAVLVHGVVFGALTYVAATQNLI